MDELKNIYNNFISIIPYDFKDSLNFSKFKNATVIAAALTFTLFSTNIQASSNNIIDNNIQTIDYNLLKDHTTFNEGYYKSPFSDSILYFGNKNKANTKYENLLTINFQKKDSFKIIDVFDIFSENLKNESQFLIDFYDTLYNKSDNNIFESYKKDSLVNISAIIHLISMNNMKEKDMEELFSTDNNYFKSTSNINLTIKTAILNNFNLLKDVKSYEETFLYADIISEKIQRVLYKNTEQSMIKYIKSINLSAPLNFHYHAIKNKTNSYSSGNIALDYSIKEYLKKHEENIVFKDDFIKNYLKKNPVSNPEEPVYKMMMTKKASSEYDHLYSKQNKNIKDEISKIYNEKIKDEKIILEQIKNTFIYFDSSDLNIDIKEALKIAKNNIKNDKTFVLSKSSSKFK